MGSARHFRKHRSNGAIFDVGAVRTLVPLVKVALRKAADVEADGEIPHLHCHIRVLRARFNDEVFREGDLPLGPQQLFAKPVGFEVNVNLLPAVPASRSGTGFFSIRLRASTITGVAVQ